jgi:lysozyme
MCGAPTGPMNEELMLGTDGADLVKFYESCKTKAYKDSVGVLTIGWGHTNAQEPHFDKNTVWAQSTCDEVFFQDMRSYEDSVKELVTVPLKQCQFDALTSFTYNCGAGNLKKSTLLKKVNAKDFEGAAKEFHKWNKAGGKVLKGLTKRRNSESLMLQGKDWQ